MTDLLFDTPWWLLAGLVAAAVALFVAGNNRQDKPLKRLAGVALALAVVLALVSFFVDTDKEKVGKQTRQLVTAVETKDAATLQRLLHPAANLLWMKKPDIVRVASEAVDAYHLKDVRMTGLDVRSTGDTIIAVFSVGASVDVNGAGGNVPTRWQITWEKLDNQWLARSIDYQGGLPGLDMQSVISRFRR